MLERTPHGGPDAPEPAPLPQSLASECDALVARATVASEARAVLPRLKSIADAFPHVLKPSLDYMSVRELARQPAGMLEAWQDLQARFEDCDKARRFIVRWFKRLHREDEAWAYIDKELPGVPTSAAHLLLKADLCYELRHFPRTEALYQAFIARFPNDSRGPVAYAKRLTEEGRGFAARALLAETVGSAKLSTAAVAQIAEMNKALAAIERHSPDAAEPHRNTQLSALTVAVERFIDTRRHPPATAALGRTALVSGSLGTGGAERQLARLAAHLTSARQTGRPVAGLEVRGDIHVVVKSLDHGKGHGFFLPMMDAHEVHTREIDDMPQQSFAQVGNDDEVVASVLPLLPPKAAYGVRRMVRYFREERIEVAYIWQDGAILFAALAALIAGVPRIVVSMRGLPPNIRTHIHHPAYEPLYRALARVPGVSFSSNSAATGRAYAAWLNIPPSRFAVVHNGVDALPLDGTEDDERRWEQFAARTGGPDVPTVGSVYRFTLDKRPALWVEFAAAYLRGRPACRFVLVGGGALLAEARERAASLGVADRILFTGTSTHVGFWMSRMDSLVLLSRYEGLPNVLIEAQSAGVPVVTTPAGGAGEAVRDGVTGFVLSSVETPDIDELCARVSETLRWKREDRHLTERLKRFVADQFSTEAMVERTVGFLCGHRETRHAA